MLQNSAFDLRSSASAGRNVWCERFRASSAWSRKASPASSRSAAISRSCCGEPTSLRTSHRGWGHALVRELGTAPRCATIVWLTGLPRSVPREDVRPIMARVIAHAPPSFVGLHYLVEGQGFGSAVAQSCRDGAEPSGARDLGDGGPLGPRGRDARGVQEPRVDSGGGRRLHRRNARPESRVGGTRRDASPDPLSEIRSWSSSSSMVLRARLRYP